ncbi:MAG TPA: hypothetical protein VMZ71_05110 [Gemmataceae bacterium]|nr:hypothetical protein [Gemmataceae bacterium]
MRTLGILLILVVAAALPAADPIPPRTVLLNKTAATPEEVGKAAGIPVTGTGTFPASFDRVPFWTALEKAAAATGQRITLRESGRRVVLEPRGASLEVSSVSGPFRTVARLVTARLNLETGQTAYDVHIDAHWEPRFPVFRVDAVPTITRATDDRNAKLTTTTTKGRSAPTGATHALPVRLGGLTRESRKIAVLAGHYSVIAADRMLAFSFDTLTAKLPVTPPAQDGVTAILKRIEKDEKTWEVEIELKYPPGGPEFESFEADAWLSENTLRLVSPDKSKTFRPDDYEARGHTLIYRFKEDAAKGLTNPAAKGWSIVYETPAPLKEFQVPFELKDIPLG